MAISGMDKWNIEYHLHHLKFPLCKQYSYKRCVKRENVVSLVSSQSCECLCIFIKQKAVELKVDIFDCLRFFLCFSSANKVIVVLVIHVVLFFK